MTSPLAISPTRLQDLVSTILQTYGVPEGDADRSAQCLVNADLRGVTSHGVGRLPIYARRLREGLVNPKPSLAVETATSVAARIDGDNGLGFVVGTKAMDIAVQSAAAHGIGMAFAYHSTHYGMAANYLMQAVEAGFAAFAFTNASPAMPIWGGKNLFLGTSPFAFAAPAPEGQTPFMLDMAMSVVARGKIRRAAARGEQIPLGWALDSEGRPTTDAQAGYEGIVLPAGGVKGSGLSLMMEILAGVMSGSAFGGEVRNQYFDFEQPQNVGHCFIALKPDIFMPRETYSERMRALAERARTCEVAEGFTEILLPGEPEARMMEKRSKDGIPMGIEEVEELAGEAEKAGVSLPDDMRDLLTSQK